MLFPRTDNNIIHVLQGSKSLEPEPIVGKTYAAFDDGKIHYSRLGHWTIDKVVNLDDNPPKDLVERLDTEISDYYWLYDPEQHNIYHATEVADEVDPGDEPLECWFIRTIDGGWFGVLSTDDLFDGMLDIDGSLMKELEEYEGKPNQITERIVNGSGGTTSEVSKAFFDENKDAIIDAVVAKASRSIIKNKEIADFKKKLDPEDPTDL